MNALLAPWTTPYALPPFDRVAPEDYPPAFEAAMAEHRAEIEAIKADVSPPSFDNTIGALERAGRSLGRVAAVFYNLAGAHTSDALQAVEREMAPKLADHRNAIILDEALYARVAKRPIDPSDHRACLALRPRVIAAITANRADVNLVKTHN
ncbi:MAG: hypothetical protein AAFZ09_16740, partial [Pseudomonadota bacterium]